MWGTNCVRKNKEVSERNGSRERAHFKKMCRACCSLKHLVWIEKKWQRWRSVVSDGAKTFFLLLFSLRGSGLPAMWLQVFQIVISKSNAHDGFHILHLFDGFFINPFKGDKKQFFT